MLDLRSLSPTKRSQILSSRLPVHSHGMTMDDLDPYVDHQSLCEGLERYTEAFTQGRILLASGSPSAGRGLVFVGSPGAGKTTLASVLCQSLIRSGTAKMWHNEPGQFLDQPVYFTSYPTLLETLKRAMGNDWDAIRLRDRMFVARPAIAVRLLVVDDLGKEHRTESGWGEKVFEHVLRERQSQGYPTIITSNTPPSDWASIYGESLASFSQQALTGFVVESQVGDRRRA